MAKTRISALAAILAVNLTATDVLPITDLSVPKTNKVTMAQLRTALFAGGTGYSSDPLACGPLTATTGTFSAAVSSVGSPSGPALSAFGDAGAGYSRIWLRNGAGATSAKNWEFAKDLTVGNSLQFTPSTAVNGTTFTTPVATLTDTGILTLVGGLTVSSGATAVQAFQATTGSFSGLVGSSADFQTTTATVAGYNFYNANFRIQVTQATGVMDFKTNNVVGFSLANGGVGASVPGTLAVGGALTAAGVITGNAGVSTTFVQIAAGGDLTLPGGGFGITNGVTRVIAVASGTNPLVTLGSTGGVSVAGTISAAAGVQITGGNFAAASITKSTVNGMLVGAVAGSTYDFSVVSPAGANILSVPTGTLNLVAAGTIGAQTLITVNRGSAASLLGYYGVFRLGTPLYYLGQDASDRGAILSASAGAANMWWDDSGNFATRGGLTTASTLTSGASVVAAASSSIVWSGRSQLTSPGDGIVTLLANSGAAITQLAFGVISSNASLVHDGAGLLVKRADNTAFTYLRAGSLLADSLNFSGLTGSAKVLGGTVGLSVRNNIDSLDNLFVSDAGVTTARAGLIATAGGVTVTAGGITVNGGTTAVQALTATTGLFTGAITTNQTTFTFIGGATDTQFKNAANNASNLTITDVGVITSRSHITSGGDVAAAAGNSHYWTGRSLLKSPADSEVQLTNNAGTSFSMLKFGPNTSGGLALKANLGSLTLQVRRADDLADASLTASTVTAATAFLVNGTQVVGARSTGWTAQVETQAKGSFGGTGAYTLTMLGQWASAIQAALTAHGLLGA